MELDNTCICVLPFFCLLKIRCTYPWWCIVASLNLGCQLPAAPRRLDGDNADVPGGLVPWMEATAGQPAARRCKCGPAAPCGARGRGMWASAAGRWHRQGGSSSPLSRLPPRRPQRWFTRLRRKASCLGTPGLPPALPARASARAGTGGPGRQVDLTGPSPRLPPVAVVARGEPLAPGRTAGPFPVPRRRVRTGCRAPEG